MKKNKKVYIIGGHESHYCNWIIPLGFSLTNRLEDSSLCIGEGGQDWDSSWYSFEKPHPTVSSNIQRDNFEMPILQEAIKLNIPILGICRNSQILPVLADKNRGAIVQHQSHPGYLHEMKTYDGLTLKINSTHHECAWPYNLDKNQYKLLAWSENLLEFRYLEGYRQEMTRPETEVVVYPNTGGGMLGIQFHPEDLWRYKEFSKTIKWCQDTLIKFLDGGFK